MHMYYGIIRAGEFAGLFRDPLGRDPLRCVITHQREQMKQ